MWQQKLYDYLRDRDCLRKAPYGNMLSLIRVELERVFIAQTDSSARPRLYATLPVVLLPPSYRRHLWHLLCINPLNHVFLESLLRDCSPAVFAEFFVSLYDHNYDYDQLTAADLNDTQQIICPISYTPVQFSQGLLTYSTTGCLTYLASPTLLARFKQDQCPFSKAPFAIIVRLADLSPDQLALLQNPETKQFKNKDEITADDYNELMRLITPELARKMYRRPISERDGQQVANDREYWSLIKGWLKRYYNLIPKFSEPPTPFAIWTMCSTERMDFKEWLLQARETAQSAPSRPVSQFLTMLQNIMREKLQANWINWLLMYDDEMLSLTSKLFLFEHWFDYCKVKLQQGSYAELQDFFATFAIAQYNHFSYSALSMLSTWLYENLPNSFQTDDFISLLTTLVKPEGQQQPAPVLFWWLYQHGEFINPWGHWQWLCARSEILRHPKIIAILATRYTYQYCEDNSLLTSVDTAETDSTILFEEFFEYRSLVKSMGVQASVFTTLPASIIEPIEQVLDDINSTVRANPDPNDEIVGPGAALSFWQNVELCQMNLRQVDPSSGIAIPDDQNQPLQAFYDQLILAMLNHNRIYALLTDPKTYSLLWPLTQSCSKTVLDILKAHHDCGHFFSEDGKMKLLMRSNNMIDNDLIAVTEKPDYAQAKITLIKKFLTIYRGLQAAQYSLFKTNQWYELNNVVDTLNDTNCHQRWASIKRYVESHPQSRSAHAWLLLQKKICNKAADENSLCIDIISYGLRHSWWGSRVDLQVFPRHYVLTSTRAQHYSFWSAATLQKQSDLFNRKYIQGPRVSAIQKHISRL